MASHVSGRSRADQTSSMVAVVEELWVKVWEGTGGNLVAHKRFGATLPSPRVPLGGGICCRVEIPEGT